MKLRLIGSTDTARASFVAFALLTTSAGCSGSSSASDGGGGRDGGIQTGRDGGATEHDGATGEHDGSTRQHDGATHEESGLGPDAADGGTPDADTNAEPAYLRNDAIGAYTYDIGFGSPYDSILGSQLNTMNSAIAPGYQTAPTAGLLSTNENFTLVATKSDVYSALNISASLSVSSGFASVNAKTTFANEVTLDTDDLWVVVDIVQTGETTKIVSPTLSASAAALSPDDFYARYGDRYAATIETGAELFCTVQIETTSQSDKTSVSASLGFTSPSSHISTSFASTLMEANSSHQVHIKCSQFGFSMMVAPTDVPSLLTAIQDFENQSASSLGNIANQTLYLGYTSYFGLAGYPGLPAGTAAKVAQQEALASDYLLYNSLVENDFASYYSDPTYSTNTFFADLKSYRDGLEAYLTASIQNSQNPGVPVPTPSAAGLITNWTTSQVLASAAGATPSYTVTSLSIPNVIPKKLSDYTIPLRYTYPMGSLNGTQFTDTVAIQTIVNLAAQSPINYPFYLVNKGGTAGIAAEYQWDTGTYFFPNIATDGAPNASLIDSAITNTGVLNSTGQYVVINEANGYVMTDNGADAMTTTHYTGSSGQLWSFYIDSGTSIDNCTAYQPPPSGTSPNDCTNDDNAIISSNPLPCGSLLYAISALNTGYWNVTSSANLSPVNASGGGGCADCNWSCTRIACPHSSCSGGPEPYDTFFLTPFNANSTWAIYNYAGSKSGAISYIEAQQPTTSSDAWPIVTDGQSSGGYPNDVWVFIATTNIDASP
jgi:hypothetical protein